MNACTQNIDISFTLSLANPCAISWNSSVDAYLGNGSLLYFSDNSDTLPSALSKNTMYLYFRNNSTSGNLYSSFANFKNDTKISTNGQS